MDPLVWTKEAPKVAGLWATYRPNPGAAYEVEPTVVRVYAGGLDGEFMWGKNLRSDGRMWCGPIKLPPTPEFVLTPTPREPGQEPGGE